MEKQCKKCGLVKDIDKFKRCKNCKGGHTSSCKVCENIKTRLYQVNNKEKVAELARNYRLRHPERFKSNARNSKLKLCYGINTVIYEELLLKQNGCCAICNNPEINNAYLSVDHDHETGVVRELLCKNCNSAIGLLKDNINLLYSAIDYLKKHKTS